MQNSGSTWGPWKMTSALESGPQCLSARDIQISTLFTAACQESEGGFPGILGLGIVVGGDGRLKSLKEVGTDPERLRTETQGACVALVMTTPSCHILV